MSKKILLLYTGPGYDDAQNGQELFNQGDCNKIVAQSGATDFLITTAQAFNYCQPGDQILTANYVNNYVDNSYFGTTNVSEIATIRNQMLNSIANNSSGGSFYNYTQYVNSAVNLAKMLINANPNCKIWFGFPPMLGNCYAAAMCYNYYYEAYIFNPIKAQMTAAGKWGNVEGFYYGEEAIVQWYTGFDPNAANDYFSNVVVQNMRTTSNTVHAAGKKFMWIPYYRDISVSHAGLRIGYVANRTDIFDYVILQPTYYFDATVGAQNVATVRNCAQQQRCVFADGSIIGGWKSSNTVIGAEMELDKDGNSRYQEYVNQFGQFIKNPTGVPIAFYANSKSVITSDAILKKIQSFFISGT